MTVDEALMVMSLEAEGAGAGVAAVTVMLARAVLVAHRTVTRGVFMMNIDSNLYLLAWVTVWASCRLLCRGSWQKQRTW